MQPEQSAPLRSPQPGEQGRGSQLRLQRGQRCGGEGAPQGERASEGLRETGELGIAAGGKGWEEEAKP